jgi:F-type H+-transporting ATPase subunit epsilon
VAAESAKKLQVAVVTPEGELWSGESDMVIAKTVEGDIGIMPGHVPVLATLTPDCVLRILGARETGEVVAAIHGGLLSKEEDREEVLAEVAELGDEINVARAEAALARARDSEDDESRQRAARARGRLRAAGADSD